MSTSFVVVPPKRFREWSSIYRLNNIFGAGTFISPHDIDYNLHVSRERALDLLVNLARLGYGNLHEQDGGTYFRPKLPITFVPSLDYAARRQFAGTQGRR